MKRMLICALLFTSCSNSRNELATSLVNQKKSLEDSIKWATNFEHYYSRQAREKMRDTDTNLWRRLVDTSVIYNMKGRDFQARLEAANFTLDSLSKMK
jgi:hypothetical protein